ncbi:hypothetical protein CHS0354_005145 [Potamilus streckersoni]|uniref:Uncharacterized protein n=1 Tax=Potamilus streckersoni TaxID=2493646 RepID=A0AAE0SI80_9BIVA|nr:hypothetical protein CHS0354_005145 [Potamilus streckersoni]
MHGVYLIMEFYLPLSILLVIISVVLEGSIVKREEGCPRNLKLANGKIKYRQKGRMARFKCKDDYELYGEKLVICMGSDWSNDSPICIKKGKNCAPFFPGPHLKFKNEKFGGALVEFECSPGYEMIGNAILHCDGKKWSSAMPTCKVSSIQTACDFEIDLCGWIQDSKDDMDWLRNVGPTQTGGTGPKGDHTLGDSSSGHYMYMEASSPTQEGDQARLESPVYPARFSDSCFELYYHMLGPDDPKHVGSLEVFIRKQLQESGDLQPLFYKEGNQGDEWKYGNFYIDRMTESFQIVIVATRMKNYVGDIAIDDLALVNCSASTTKAFPGATSSTTTDITPSTQPPAFSSTEIRTPKSEKKTKQTQISAVPTVMSTPIISTTNEVKTPSTRKETTSMKPVQSTTDFKQQTTIHSFQSSTGIKQNATAQPTSNHTISSTTTQNRTSPTIGISLFSSKEPKVISASSSKGPTTEHMTEKVTTKLMTTQTTQSNETTNATTPKEVSTIQILTTSIEKETTNPPNETTAIKTPPPTISRTSFSTQKIAVTSEAFNTTTTSKKFASESPNRTSPTETLPFTQSTLSKNFSFETTNITYIFTTANFLLTNMTETSENSSSSPLLTTNFSTSFDVTEKVTYFVFSTTPRDTGKPFVAQQRKEAEDTPIKPLLIGLGVGLFAGLVVIAIVAWVCVKKRERKKYERYGEELEPIADSENFGSVQYYQDDLNHER